MGFSRQEYCNELPFPLSLDHVLSEHFSTAHPSFVALQGMAHSFTVLYKSLRNDKSVIYKGEMQYAILIKAP